MGWHTKSKLAVQINQTFWIKTKNRKNPKSKISKKLKAVRSIAHFTKTASFNDKGRYWKSTQYVQYIRAHLRYRNKQCLTVFFFSIQNSLLLIQYNLGISSFMSSMGMFFITGAWLAGISSQNAALLAVFG